MNERVYYQVGNHLWEGVRSISKHLSNNHPQTIQPKINHPPILSHNFSSFHTFFPFILFILSPSIIMFIHSTYIYVYSSTCIYIIHVLSFSSSMVINNKTKKIPNRNRYIKSDKSGKFVKKIYIYIFILRYKSLFKSLLSLLVEIMLDAEVH